MASNVSNGPLVSVSDLIGSWGPLQRKLLFFLVVIYIMTPFNYFELYFYGRNDDLWCKNANGTQSIIIIHSSDCSFSLLDTCESWGFSSDRLSVSQEWNLICEYYWMRAILTTINMLGYLFSSIVIGIISDNYGRKFALRLSIIMEIVVQICLIFTENLYLFMGLRFIHGFAGYGRYSSTLILSMETVGTALRGRVVVFFDWLWFISFTLIAFHHIINFKLISIFVSMYQLVSLVALYYLPESPRWQLVSGDRSEAQKLLRKYSPLDESTFNTKFNQLCYTLDEDKKREKVCVTILVKHWTTIRLFTCLWAIWGFRSFLQNGLNIVTYDLSGSVFINQAVFTAAGCTSNALMGFIVERYERRNVLTAILLVASTMSLMCIPFIRIGYDIGYPMVVDTLLFLAHGTVSSAFGLLTAYTAEIFPTKIRSFCFGTCFAFDRIAFSSSSFIKKLTTSTNLRLSLTVLAIPGLLASLLTTLLIKTNGREIQDTIGQFLNGKLSKDINLQKLKSERKNIQAQR